MPYKVLVVDDENAIRDLFVELLKRDKCYCKDTGTGEEAIDIVKKEDFDIVLLDIKLPGISGLDTLKKIKELKPDLPVVMITGFSYDEELMQKSKQYGCSGYIVKNMSPSEIMKTLNSLIKSFAKTKD